MNIKRYLSLGLCAATLAASGCSDDDDAILPGDGGLGDGGLVDGGIGGDAGLPDGSAATCSVGGSGQVTVTVVAPEALTPLARLVSGMGGAPLDLAGAMPATIPAGPYAVEHKRVKVAPGPMQLIGRAYYVSAIGFDGCVRAGVTNTVTLTYTLEPGSAKLWATPGNRAGAIVAYDEAQLRAGGAAAPTVVRGSGLTAVGDIAFDLHGNLWASDRTTGLAAYPMNTLGIAADRVAALKIPGYTEIVSLAFDGGGNLWAAQALAEQPADRIVRWSEASLQVDPLTTNTLTRMVAHNLELTSAELKGPVDMAFDAAGNLWVTSRDKHQVLMFSVAQLAAGGNVAPAVVLKARVTGPIVGGFDRPIGLSFDATGNLWAGWEAALLRFAPAQLAASATIDDPHRVQPQGQGGAGVSDAPHAIDALGGMWLSRAQIGGPAALVRLPPAALTAGGKQAPMEILSSEALGSGASSIVLNPTPAGLPIRD